VNKAGSTAASMLERNAGFSPYFADVDRRRWIDQQTCPIAHFVGGPAGYTNGLVERVHAPLTIERRSFIEATRRARERLIVTR
jgi:hypothetical protein